MTEEDQRVSRASCLHLLIEHSDARNAHGSEMLSKFATNNPGSNEHDGKVNKHQNYQIGKEYIQMIVISSDVEVYTNDGDLFGAKTTTKVDSGGILDWKAAKLVIYAQ